MNQPLSVGSGRWFRAGGRQLVIELSEEEGELFETGGATVRRGSTGSDVTELQRKLSAVGFSPGPIDGIFGSGTDAAVRAFQRARGLLVDGIVGPQTWGALSGAQAPGTTGPRPAATVSSVMIIGDSHLGSQAFRSRLELVLRGGGFSTVTVEQHNGWSTRQYIQSGLAARLAAAKPHVVVFQLGGNDQDPDAAYPNTLTEAVRAAVRAGATRVVWLGPATARRSPFRELHERHANLQHDLLPGIAKAAGVRLVWFDSRPFTLTGHQPDGVHFTPPTYTAWGAMAGAFILGSSVGPAVTPATPTTPTTPGSGTTDWSNVSDDQRMRYVMGLLVNRYGYSINAAAGIVGNLYAESGVIPSRIEGSRSQTPMRARNFRDVETDFTAEQVMTRDSATGPKLPGAGLAQWTSRNRRVGLFQHTYNGQRPGARILFDMDAQVDYLVTELRSSYRTVNSVLIDPSVTLDDASDEVVYRFEVPGSVLGPSGTLRPRSDPAVQQVFARRRGYSRQALRAFTQ